MRPWTARCAGRAVQQVAQAVAVLQAWPYGTWQAGKHAAECC